MLEAEVGRLLRESAMNWLERQGSDLVTQAELATFEFAGRRLPLMDRQRGIRKPAGMDAALSIRTVFTPPRAIPPYADAEGPDGLIRYKYRGEDPMHAENRALRRAMEDKLPLIWFVGVASAQYLARYPVWILAEEPDQLQFVIAVDEAQRWVDRGDMFDPAVKRYMETRNKVRLHQPLFRARVLAAYESRCALCRLRHVELLDAAHIIPDGQPNGDPVVPNGLAMCKIHHAAYDRNILGVRPDLVVEVRRDILDEVDGPMLRHGLQAMNGLTVTVPASRGSQPDHARLEQRYAEFSR